MKKTFLLMAALVSLGVHAQKQWTLEDCINYAMENNSNSGVEKNSPSVMSRPSQIFLMVKIFGSALLPYRMFFTEEGGSAETVASLLMEMSRSAHRRRIRSLIAVIVSIAAPAFLSQAYRFTLAKVGYPCYHLGYT